MAPTVLLGRDVELERLHSAAVQAAGGEGRLVVVVGETGIGKTALADEFTRRAEAAGSRVARGGAPSGHGHLPYAPVVDALRGSLDRYSHDLLQALPPHQVRELARLVPEIANDSTGTLPTNGELAQLRLFESVLAWSRQLATPEGAGVVVLEDVHWADTSTAEFLAYLAHAIVTTRLVAVVTARPDGLASIAWLRHLLLDAARRNPDSVVELQPLPEQETHALVAGRLGGRHDDRVVGHVVARSGGNPYFVEELTRSIDVGRGQVPETLKGLIVDRLSHLSEPAQYVLQLAAVHGSRGPVDLLLATARLPTAEASRAVREARDESFLGLEEGVWTFRHPLVAEVLYSELLPAERRALHRALAETLGSDGRAAGRPSPGLAMALARHWYEAGTAEQAFPALIVAAEVAEESQAFPEAHELYERALALRPHVPVKGDPPGMGFRPRGVAEHPSPPDLLQRAAAAASYAGQPGRAVELLGRSLQQELTSSDRLLLQERMGRYLLEAGDSDRSLEVYEAAAREARVREDAVSARVLAGYARALQLLGRHQVARTIAQEAVHQAIAAHAQVDEMQARATLGASLVALGEVEEGLRELDGMRRLQEMLGSPSRVRSSRFVDVLSAYVGAASALNRAGQGDASLGVATQGRATAERFGIRGVWGGLLGSVAAAELFDQGRWTEAQDLVAKLVAEGGSEASAARVVWARILLARGLADEAMAELGEVRGEALRGSDSAALFFSTTAELAMSHGDLDGARRSVEAGLTEIGAGGDPLALAQLAAIGLRVDAERAATARLRRASADLTELRRDADLLRSLVAGGRGTREPNTTKHAAVLLLAEAEFDRVSGTLDPTSWGQVVAAFDYLRAPHVGAYARLRLAECHLVDNRDRKAAEQVLREAVASTDELGALPLTREIHALARRARIDLEAAVERSDEIAEESAAKRLGISPREVEVIDLLVQGRTNREIAEALFITEKTAGHHVSNILGKFGVRGRVEAAAAAIRLNIAGHDMGYQEVPSAIGPPATGIAMRTFFFSDIVDSTSLLGVIGDDAWAHLVTWHDSTLRALFRKHGGEEIDHAGDGFFVAFRLATDAIECAIAIQRTLAAHRRSHGFAPRVRIGVHAGDARREGRAFRGRAVHEAARIAASAAADEIVASQATLTGSARRYRTLQLRTVQLRGLSQSTDTATIDWS